jgi:hypothetical protein
LKTPPNRQSNQHLSGTILESTKTKIPLLCFGFFEQERKGALMVSWSAIINMRPEKTYKKVSETKLLGVKTKKPGTHTKKTSKDDLFAST